MGAAFELARVPTALRPALEEQLARLAALDGIAEPLDPQLRAELPAVWVGSQFVADTAMRDPQWLHWLAHAGRRHADATGAWLAGELGSMVPEDADDAQFIDGLRRFRRRQLARIAWRDLAGLAPVDTVLDELSMLADTCIAAACARANRELAARHGVPCRADGSPLALLVLGMGKLGGGELNFSSDVDLVFLFPEHGETGGPAAARRTRSTSPGSDDVSRSCSGTVTHDGFVYRVDLRLRPFGESGPLVVSFGAFEDYLQQHGRDWERYAYVKARPGHRWRAASRTLYRNVLRPFVYPPLPRFRRVRIAARA